MVNATKERFLTVGFIGEADIDTESTPEATLKNLCDIAEQCGYMAYKGYWNNYNREIILETPEGQFFIMYECDSVTWEFKGVFIKKRIQ